MLPQIEFVYNKEYDNVYRDLWYLSNTTGAKYPSDEIDIQEYINNHIKPIREKYGEKILRKIEEIGIYKWTEKYIPIYIIGSAKSLWGGTTNPITIAIRKKPEWMLDVIVHELIHYYQFIKWGIFEKYCLRSIKLHSIKDINNAMHIILYAMQYNIYNKIPDQRNYTLAVLEKQNELYKGYINKVLEIGFDNILNEYRLFMEGQTFKLPNQEYAILQYINSNSYSKVFNKIGNFKTDNYKDIEDLRTGKNIEDYKISLVNDNSKILLQTPKIISNITNIKRKFQYIKIHLVPTDPYNINIPMTIGLYQNEDNIENLTIEKVIKYFIYFHKEEIKEYCKKENIEEDKLFDYLFENVKKELALIG